jgi:hypothetical protein
LATKIDTRKRRIAASIQIQRVFRGHQGRLKAAAYKRGLVKDMKSIVMSWRRHNIRVKTAARFSQDATKTALLKTFLSKLFEHGSNSVSNTRLAQEAKRHALHHPVSTSGGNNKNINHNPLLERKSLHSSPRVSVSSDIYGNNGSLNDGLVLPRAHQPVASPRAQRHLSVKQALLDSDDELEDEQEIDRMRAIGKLDLQ